MNTVASFCRNCGRALTEEEKAKPGTYVCSSCAESTAAEPLTTTASAIPPNPAPEIPRYTPPPPASASPYTAPSGTGSPGLAFILGLIPGVGAIYNGQYVKGLVHAFVFGLLLSIMNSERNEPMFGLMMMAWMAYMAFEAYHTARRRREGIYVDEFSSVVPLRGHSIAGPAAIIAVGVLFLLNNLDLLRIGRLIRYWPLLLIGLGVYLLYVRLFDGSAAPAIREEAHERN